MPTYEYECETCGHRFDAFQNMSDPALSTCPSCNEESLRRLIGGGIGVIFKGSGFYVNDSKKGSSGNGSAAAGSSSGNKTAKESTSSGNGSSGDGSSGSQDAGSGTDANSSGAGSSTGAGGSARKTEGAAT